MPAGSDETADREGPGIDTGAFSLFATQGSRRHRRRDDFHASTVDVDGQAWRSLVVQASGGEIQVLQSLQPAEERLAEARRLLALGTAVAAVVTGVAVWVVAGLALRPLRRLQAEAAAVRENRAGTTHLDVQPGPREITELSQTLNAMLDRLGESMDATRRFTADAGHELRNPLAGLGADLETLRRNAELGPADRAEILAAMTDEHGRLVAMLDGLQALARGDAGVLPVVDEVDLVELVDDAVADARRRHPGARYTIKRDTGSRSESSAVVRGWQPGLRIAVDNLLQNAARHAGPEPRVVVSVDVDPHGVTLAVDDDGPGVAPDELDRLTGRFVRGRRATAPGSGLGRAVVEQQTRLHGGRLELTPSSRGGLRAELTLPAGGAPTRNQPRADMAR